MWQNSTTFLLNFANVAVESGPREVGEDRLARLRRFCPGLGETENPIRVLQVRKLKLAVAQLREPLLRLRHRRRRQGDGRRDDKRRDQAT